MIKLTRLFRKSKEPCTSLTPKVWMALSCLSILQLYMIELFNQGSFSATATWFVVSPKILLLNYLLLLGVNLIFIMITGSVYSAGLLSSFMLPLFSWVSLNKSNLLGHPLFPWDFTLQKYAWDLIPYTYRAYDYAALSLFFAGLLALILLNKLTKAYTMPLKHRLFWGLLSCCLIAVMSISPVVTHSVLPTIGIINMEHNQNENYHKHGFTLAFFMNMKNLIISKPPNYSETAMHQKVSAIKTFVTDRPGSLSKKPNVILVMSEAFWDPTVLKGVSFSSDPLPTLRVLMENHTHGQLISPAYGGGTSNVEFEILTGHNMGFFHEGANPYQQYITTPLPSLVSLFKANGYKTLAIHSYYKWFFSRERVYPLLGFEQFIGLEDFINPSLKGFYIADEDVSQRIILEYEQSSDPVFIYAITMQNHGPYEYKRYQNPEIKVESKGLSKKSASILEQYAQGVLDADRSLKTLIDYFGQQEEPTLIVFFGDHLPLLGNNYSVYYESGFVQSPQETWSHEEYLALHATPLLFWTNYPTKMLDIKEISASYLAPLILETIHMEKPLYYQFLDYASSQVPVNLRHLKMAAQHELSNEITETQDIKALNDLYWAFQYDMIFGNRYTMDLLMK